MAPIKKTTVTFIAIFFLLFCTSASTFVRHFETDDKVTAAAKPSEATTEVKYRRSSLYTLMLDQPALPKADVIKSVFLNTPIPDKFNDHNLDTRIIQGLKYEKDQEKDISAYLSKSNVARDMVAKWFDRNAQGGFDMNLIADRGSYNATEMDANLAQKSKRGLAQLADAGEELIGNTFVLVSSYKYISKKELGNKINKAANATSAVASRFGVNVSAVNNAAQKGINVVDEGYVVVITSYLYQLDWNDSVAAVFYNSYWNEGANINADRKSAFENSNIFTLKYIGSDNAMADVQSASFLKTPEETLIKLAAKRSIDKVIVKLQKQHEVFRTKTPLYSVDPLAAKIGVKEGLEAGDKYAVLEQTQDEDGRTHYKKVGIIKVEKDHIWNNDYNATGEIEDGKTIFKGSGKYYPGMLIKQEY